jgi:ureidoglycolate lyase
MSAATTLRPEPLTAQAFALFGDVIEATGAAELVNAGTAKSFADLARVDVATSEGRPRVGIYRVIPYELPLAIRMLERHALGSQLFMPLHGEPFLVVVAPPGDRIDPGSVRAFVTDGRQGVNYRPGTWHHPVIALRNPSEFLVVDRGGPGKNFEEYSLESAALVVSRPHD